MLISIIAILAFTVLLATYNFVQSKRNSDANFRRKIMAHIDREIAAIELTQSGSRQFSAVNDQLEHHTERIASMQGQINQLKGKISPSNQPRQPERVSGDGIGALLDANRASAEPENTPQESVPHYLNYV